MANQQANGVRGTHSEDIGNPLFEELNVDVYSHKLRGGDQT